MLILFIASILVIVMWGIIDKKSLRRVPLSARIGIFTYLLSLIVFLIGDMLAKYGIFNNTLITDSIGVVFMVVTLLSICIWVRVGISSFKMGKVGNSFWESAIM